MAYKYIHQSLLCASPCRSFYCKPMFNNKNYTWTNIWNFLVLFCFVFFQTNTQSASLMKHIWLTSKRCHHFQSFGIKVREMKNINTNVPWAGFYLFLCNVQLLTAVLDIHCLFFGGKGRKGWGFFIFIDWFSFILKSICRITWDIVSTFYYCFLRMFLVHLKN